MERFLQIVVPVVLFAVCFSNVAAYQSDETMRAYMKLLSIPQKPERYLMKEKYHQPKSPSVSSFNWKSCGAATDPITADVELSPDPLPIPGNITISGNATLNVDVVSPVKLVLKVQKKVLVWITIPCVDELGSCTYVDACTLLPPAPCPPPFSTYNLPCNCPFKSGTYSLPPSVMEVENVNIPSWLTSGDYKVNARVSDSSGKELACYDVAVTLN